MIEFASVDLPEPLGPMSAWTSPRETRRSTPLRISLELVASVSAPGGPHELGFSKPGDELLQVRERKPLGLGDLGERHGPLTVAPAELDHHPHAVLRPCREHHLSINPSSCVARP